MLDHERISALTKEAGSVAIATVVRAEGSTPREIGSKMVVMPHGKTEGTIGGGKLEDLVIKDAMALLDTGGCAYKEYGLRPEKEGGIGTECGGQVAVFIEVAGRPESLVILGGGHVGLALYQLAKVLDMQVTVVDDREEFASQQRFPQAKVVRADYDDPKLRKLVWPRTSVVILTHAHMHDAEALKNMLPTNAAYIGMIGSKRKVPKVKERLRGEGVAKKDLDRVYAPVGLDIGAQTPAEIAVSIMAEIVHVRKFGKPSTVGMGRKK